MNITANATAQLPAKVNRLTQTQSYKLCQILKAMFEAGDFRTSDTYASLAEAASTALSFSVTRNNVKGAFETLEITLPEPEAKDAALQRRVQMLEAVVRRLCVELQVPCNLG